MPPVQSLANVLADGQNISQALFSTSMRGVVVGPKAKLIRYAQSGEKASGLLASTYDANNDATLSIPGFETGNIFDSTYSGLGVTFENAYLLYATKLATGSNPKIGYVTDYDNRIASNAGSLIFADGGGSSHTTPTFGDRGVKVGDVLHLYATVSSSLKELWTSVTGLVNDTTAATVGSAAAGSSNKAGTSASATTTKVATTPNNHVKLVASASAWDPTYDPNDTYTITVATAGAGGNGGAKINVTSSKGDNKLNVPVATFASATIATERGLSLTFSLDGTQPVDPGVSADVMVTTDGTGTYNPQQWTVVVVGAHTAATATAGGTYVGTEVDKTFTYTAEVTRGGVYPQQLQPAPTTQATVVVNAGAGSLQTGNYYVAYTWVNSSGETTMGGESNVFTVTNPGDIPTVTFPALPIGVTSLNVYLTAAAGASLSEKLYKTGVQSLTTTLTAATAGGAASPPGTNTCVVNKAQTAPVQIPVADVTGGGATGGLLQAGAYYCKYTYVNSTGETTVSPESAQFTVVAGNIPRLYLPILPTGVTSINVYLTAAAGGTGTEVLYTTGVVTTSAKPYYDLSIVQANNGTMPTVNSCQRNAALVCPLLNITRTDGVDGATNVQYLRTGTTVSVGALGVTLSFNQSELIRGDRYTIAVTSKATGPVKTLQLMHGLTAAGLNTTIDLNVEFYILESSIGVPQKNPSSPYSDFWTLNTSTPNIILRRGIKLFDSANTWKVSGVLTSLPVTKITGSYLSYRQWYTATSSTMGSISDIDTVASVLGTVDPDNPIAQGVSLALLQTPSAQNVTVRNTDNNVVNYVMTIADPTLTSTWQTAIDTITGEGVTGAYKIAPLTTDSAVLSLFADNMTSESAAANGNMRSMFAPTTITTSTALVNQTINSNVLVTATLIQDPSVTSTSYTLLQGTTGQGRFITRGVQAGDTVRYKYGADVSGNSTYNSYTVASVISEDALTLTSGPSAPENSAIRVEVYHPHSKAELVSQVAAQAATYGNRRVSTIWPDLVSLGTSTYPSYYYGAAYAGLQGAVAPHQGLTKVELKGFGTDPRATYFTNNQLTTLSNDGVWVVRQQSTDEGGRLYCQQAVTTANNGVAADTEEAAVRVADAISFAYQNAWSARYGSTNINTLTMAQLATDFRSVTAVLKGASTPSLGSVVTDATLVSLTQHPTNLTRLQAVIRVTFSYPLNKVELTVTL